MSKLENIGFYTLSDERVRNTNLRSPLWRCELILTDKCNFSCPYCRGVHNDIKGTMPMDQARKIIDLWTDNNLKNIRFSGGEPTLYPNICDIVRYAKIKGIGRIALSTNGSASISLYEKLLKCGVNDFSISLDACCSSDGDMFSGTTGKWENVIETIKYLSQLTYVTVGVVITDNNISQLKDIIEFAFNLGIADIRIISAAQNNKLDNDFELDPVIIETNPILKYRINNLKRNRGVRGIQEEDCHKCRLVIDDMAIAGNYHFPCIIYLREQGNPIGTIGNKSIEEIRKERILWSERSTYGDRICRYNCLDVCIDYNNRYRDLRI